MPITVRTKSGILLGRLIAECASVYWTEVISRDVVLVKFSLIRENLFTHVAFYTPMGSPLFFYIIYDFFINCLAIYKILEFLTEKFVHAIATQPSSLSRFTCFLLTPTRSINSANAIFLFIAIQNFHNTNIDH